MGNGEQHIEKSNNEMKTSKASKKKKNRKSSEMSKVVETDSSTLKQKEEHNLSSIESNNISHSISLKVFCKILPMKVPQIKQKTLKSLQRKTKKIKLSNISKNLLMIIQQPPLKCLKKQAWNKT